MFHLFGKCAFAAVLIILVAFECSFGNSKMNREAIRHMEQSIENVYKLCRLIEMVVKLPYLIHLA